MHPGYRICMRTVNDPDNLSPAVAPRRRFGRREGRVDDDRPAGRGRGGAVADGAGSLLLTLARIVRFITGVIVTIIVAAILLRVLEANQSNSLVEFVTDLGRSLVGPFKDLFTIENAKTEIAVNWGLAALAYAIVGGLIASLLARAGLSTADRGRR